MREGLVVLPKYRAHSSHAEVARTIGIDIIAGRLKEGSKLPGDTELTSRFGVSRPVLREGMRTLVAKGFLVAKARVGTTVRERADWNMFDGDVLAWHLHSGIDRRFLRDLAEIRLAVEPEAAALAAHRRSPADLRAMRAGIARMTREAGNSIGFAAGDVELHIAIANASGNPFMRSIGAVIDAALRASFILSAPAAPADRDEVLAKHGAIVDAISARNADAAATAMRDVIFNGLRRQGTSLDPTDVREVG